MKWNRILAGMLAAVLLMGCAENPDSDIIVHKDMEKVIDEAQEHDSKEDVGQLHKYDSYTTALQNESLRVSIHADAAVDIPKTDRLSLLRVEQRPFTQEDCDRVRLALMGDTPLFDLTKTKHIIPRARLEEGLSSMRQALDEKKVQLQDPDYAKQLQADLRATGAADSLEAYLEQQQAKIDELESEYLAAPLNIDYSAYPSNGTLEHNADRIAAEADENGFWHSYCRDMPDGDTLWVCSEDETSLLHVQNSENYSNVIWYSHSPVGFCDLGTYIIELPPISELNFTDSNLDTIDGETCTLTQKAAEGQAQQILQKIGVEDFVCFDRATVSAVSPITVLNATNGAEETHTYVRPCHVLRYCRAIGGVPLEQPSGTKKMESSDGGDYTEKRWPAEVIEFRINDSGIIQFQWNAPLQITETVVDQAAMKPFPEIAAAFEKMLPMTAAQEIAVLQTKVSIDRVTLSYSRLSEKNDFDKGLIVPVWAFHGSRTVSGEDYFDEHQSFSGVQMAINAIDGSVIDMALGY